MILFCCSCSNLDTKKKSAGKVNGNLYYCKKMKTYVNASKTGCEKFEKASGRKSWETDELYKDGKLYDNDTTPISLYLFLMVILIILGLILGVFGKL